MNQITCHLSAMIWDECSHCEGVGMGHWGFMGSYSWSVQQMGVFVGGEDKTEKFDAPQVLD